MRALLLDNLPLKIVALILAVTLVIVKHEEKVAFRTFKVPIRVSHPENRVLVSAVDVDSVQITVEGSYGELSKLDIPPLEVRLSGFEGETYNFERELFNVPPGLLVRDVRPPAMLLRFEEKLLTSRPVKADLQGLPQEGFRLVKFEVQPPRIDVEGAKSAVERLEEVMTSRIDLNGRDQSIVLDVELTKPPENVAFLRGNQVYRVALTIEEKIDTRVMEGLTITVQGEPAGSPGYEVSPPTANVTLRGPVSRLDALDPARLAVFVNVAGVSPSKRILKSRVVDAAGPPELTVLEVKPDKVTLVQNPIPEPASPDAGVP